MKASQLNVLTDDECDALASGALQLLDETGVVVTLAEARDVLLAAGGREGDSGRILLEESVVRAALAAAPERFSLHDRLGGVVEIGAGRCWTKPGGTVSRVMEYPGWSLRDATRQDVARFARLCDALPNAHTTLPVVEPQDVDRSLAEVISVQETIANSSKFITVCPVEHSTAKTCVELARIATGTTDLSREPKMGLLATVLPNMHLDDDCAATTMLAAREGIPLVVMAGAVSGSSSPYTIAAATAMKIAGEMFHTTLAQRVRPGTPTLWDIGSMVLDMRTADLSEAGPENGLSTAAMCQVAQQFAMPTYCCSLHCDGKIGDFQTGLEKAAGLMSAFLAGVSLTANMGLLSRCSAASYEQMVLDDELCAYLQRFRQGVAVNEDTLGLDVIREVGVGGEFITHPHTARHCRSGEVWNPALLDRTSVGARTSDLYGRAADRVREILESHQPQVDAEVREALDAYVRKLR